MRSLPRRAPPVIAVLLALAIGALYVESVPPWEAPDEPWHMVYVEAVSAGRLPTADETYEAHQPPTYYLWPALALRVMGAAPVPRAPDNPRYPFDSAAVWHTEADPAVRVMRVIRTFSGFLALLAVALAWSTARVVWPGSVRRAALTALLVALWPQFAFIAHSVSNDTLAAAVGALLTYGLVVAASRPNETARAVLALSVGGALAIATKVNVLALVFAAPLVSVLVLVAGHDHRSTTDRTPSPTATRLARAAAVTFAPLLGALAVYLAASAALPTSAAAVVGRVLDHGSVVRPELAEPAYLLRQTGRMLLSAWARFGWLNVDVPRAFYAAAGLGAFGAGLGLAATIGRASAPERRSLVAAGAVVLAMLAAGAKNLVYDPQPQGRLLFPALSAFALLLAAGALAYVPSRRRWPVAVAVAACLAVVNIHVTSETLPDAYAPARGALPAVETRVSPPRPIIAATLIGHGGTARQTFEVLGAGLHRVEAPVVDAEGDGVVIVRLRSVDDGSALAEESVPLASIRRGDWLGVDVGPLPRGQLRLAFELELDVDHGATGQLRLWGAPNDIYAGGALEVNGQPATDLMLLTIMSPDL